MDALPDEEKVRQVLRELRKRESKYHRGIILTMAPSPVAKSSSMTSYGSKRGSSGRHPTSSASSRRSTLYNTCSLIEVLSIVNNEFTINMQSKSSTHLRTEPLSKDTKEPKTSSHNTGAVHRGSIRNLKRDDEASLCGQLKSNQKLLMVELDPSILVPTVLETCEEKPRLLVVGPRNIKSLSGSLIRIGDRIVAVSGRNEELRPTTESSSPTPPSESACSRILVGIKSEFDGICERAITNGQRIGLALIREQTNMVLSGEWTQVEVVRLSTTSGGLGFGIVGGSSTGVVVKTILPGSPADKDKRLRPGDHILQIGKVNTQGMTSQQVASILRQQEYVVELIVGRSIIPSEAPADCSDCWIMTTRAALNPARLEEEIREKTDNVLLRKKQTGTTDLLQNGHMGSVERPPTSPPPAPPSHPTQKSIDIDTGSQKGQKPETSSSNVSSPTEKTQKKSSVTSRTSEKRLSLDGSLSYGTSQGNATVAKSEMQPSTSSPPTVPQKLSLKALQEMALTVFLRENWEASGRFDTIDVVLHRDPTLGLGITVAGYVHKKAEIGGVFVKSLVPNSAAIQSGAIQIHDLILQVNGESLEHLSHADSVRTLVRSGDTVRLSLVRFHPGTPQSLCIEMLHNQCNDQPTAPSILSDDQENNDQKRATSETETQVIDVESSNPGLVAEWKKRLSGDVDIIQAVLRADTNQSGDGGLGIALEGTVDVVDGTQLCPHHYIGSIRRDGPAAKTGLLQAGDELLQVNHFSLFGESHVTVRNALTRAVLSNAPVTLIVARKTQQLNVFLPGGDRSLPLSYPLLASGSCQVVKAKSDICISGLKERTEELLEEVSRRLRSRSLEPLAGMAIWTCVPMVVWLQKDHRGLGFSVVDYKDPMHRGESVIVVQSLVPGGVAQADGRIVPGDRLLFVNDHDLSNSSLERAVAVLKAAPMGAVRLGVAKPIPVEQGGLSAHSPLISRSERFLAQGSSPTSSRRNKGSTHSSQETVWIGVDQYRRLHPQGYYPSRSPSAKSHQSSLNGSSLSMTSWSPCSSRSLSPCASPALSLKGSWAYDVIYLPAHLERTVKIPKGSLALGITLNAEKDKGVNGCVVKSVCGKKAIAKDGRIQVGDHIVMINNESLRDVTPAQARAILKRTNLMGSTCSITYITGSDAKLWKERFARDSEPQTPPISRLSPKVFPKFYKSPYMGGNNRLPRDTSPDDTDVSLSLTHDHVDECLPGPSSQIPVDSRVKSRFIDGLYVENLAHELMQGAISDAVLELLFAQITPEWKGAKLEERRESSERPPLPSSPPPESIAEEETEGRSTDIRIEQREECSSLERPVETVFIKRDSAPASTSSRLDVQTLNFPHLDSSEERSLGGGESEEKVEKISRPLTGETSEDLAEGVEKAEKSSQLVIAKEVEKKTNETSERIESTEKIEETERRQSFEAEPETAEAEAVAKSPEESSPVPLSSPEEPPMSKVVVKPFTEVEPQDEPQESKGTNGLPAIETLPSTSPQKPVDTETDKSAETQSLASSMDSTSKEKTAQKSKFWGEARTVILNRDPNKSFGISIVGGRVEVSQKGGLPGTGNTVSGIFIKTVLPDSPAGRTRMMSMGDRVLSVNDIDLRDATHEQAVKAIRTAENPVKFVLQSLHSFTPQQQMVTSPSASSSQSNAHVESVTVEERRKDPCVYGVPSTSDGRSSHSGSEPPVSRNIHTQDSVDALARAGVEPGSAAALPRAMDDDGQPSPYGYTAKKISQKYGYLPGEVLLLEVEEVPEAGLGMSLQGKRYGDKMAVSVVSARAACPLPVLPGDELLEINGRVLFDLNHITASQKIRRCCEDGFVELLVLRRFQERRDSQPSKGDTDEPQENTDDAQAEEAVTSTGEEKENESTMKDEDTTRNVEEGADNETDISHLESVITTENEKVADVVEDTQDTVEEVVQQVSIEPLPEEVEEAVPPVQEVEEPIIEQNPTTPPPATTNTRAATVNTSAPMPPAQDDSAAALHSVDAVRKKSFVEKCTVIDTGKETLIEIDKDGKGLGLSIVGGSDTVLGTVVIHEVYPDGAAAIDGRLKPGDQVLEVNSVSLRGVTHEKAISLLRRTPPKVRLLVYRDVNLQLSLLDPTQIYNIFEVDLQKKPGRGLGLSIVGRKNEPGVYVSEVVKGGAADADGRLITGDQILSVNGTDVANSMQEDVAAMLKACVGKVQLKIGRWKITETATRVHAAAEAAYGKSTTTVTVPNEEVTSSSTSPRTEKSLPSSVREDLSPASSYSPSTPSSAPLPAPVPPPSLPTTSRPIITHTPPDGEGQEMPLSSGLSPVTEEPSSGTIEQSMHAEEDRSSAHPSSAGRTTPSVGAPSGSGITSGVSSPAPSVPSPSPSGFSGHCELLTELNEEGSDTVLIELRKHPEQQLGMGIGKRSRGILVTSLQPGSVAAEKLKVGDRILAVNALPVTDQLSAVTFVKASGERLFLQVARPRQNPHP